nr:putative metallopeptidase [Sinorhizobium medicae]
MPEWIKAAFLDPSSPLHNEEHAHLAHAEIGFLWTVVKNSRKGRRIIGQCEEGKPQGAMGVVRLRPGFHHHARCRILPGMWRARLHYSRT